MLEMISKNSIALPSQKVTHLINVMIILF